MQSLPADVAQITESVGAGERGDDAAAAAGCERARPRRACVAAGRHFVLLRSFEYSRCVPPSIHTVPPSTHCKRLLMPSWPVAFAALPNGPGVASEAQSQLPEPISQSARRPPRGLFGVACRSRPLRPLPFVAVGGSRPTALQTISAHPTDVQIVEDFLGILKWQYNQTHAKPLPPSLEPHCLISEAPTRHCRAAVLRGHALLEQTWAGPKVQGMWHVARLLHVA